MVQETMFCVLFTGITIIGCLVTGSTQNGVHEDVLIQYDPFDINSPIPIMTSIVVTVKISNTARSHIQNVLMTYIYSKEINITQISVDEVLKENTKSGFESLITTQLRVRQTVSIGFYVIIDNHKTIDSGYHLANVLVSFKWIKMGVIHNIGYNSVLLPYVKPGCETVFDVKSGAIRPDQVSATSYYTSSPPHSFDGNGWCAKVVDEHQHLEILFDRTVRLTCIRTGRRKEKGNWILNYRIACKHDGKWADYTENGFTKFFTGHQDINSTSGWLANPLECDGVRIHPTIWQSPLICTMLDIKGCYISNVDNCISPIGMESGVIPNASLSDRSEIIPNVPNKTYYGRLNVNVTTYPHGWLGQKQRDWLQIDLGSLFKVTRVGIQAAFSRSFHITKFNVSYSNDTHTWYTFRENMTVKIFHDPIDSNVARFPNYISLPHPIWARSFRIEPVDFVNTRVVRAEIYGCLIKSKATETFPDVPSRSVLVDKKHGSIYMCQQSEEHKNTCFKGEETDGFKKWISFPKKIVSIIATDKDNNYYGITNQGTYVINENGSSEWRDISNSAWENDKQKKALVLAVKVPNIVPRTILKNMTWTLNSNKQAAVSGIGIHIRQQESSKWNIRATWSCCGL